MSIEWLAAIAFAILLALVTWLRQSGPDWIEPVAITLMIAASVALVASFLAAILLPIVFRRR
jgi:hypothetical protein